ncbi:MAG: hypothetical protein WDO19_01045 [Bacteroidota bacterium]
MKRIKFPPFIDMIIVDDASTIRELANDTRIDRSFKLRPLINGAILKRALVNLSYNGAHFPHMTPKNDAQRSIRQNDLWNLYNARSIVMASGPGELEPLAQWIREENNDQESGVLVQQIFGQFFNPGFHATAESWKAALILREDANSMNLLKMIWWQFLGKARNAKKLLGSMVNDDIYAMHAIAVASHNMVAAVHILKNLYADKVSRNNTTPEQAVQLSLSPPPRVFRQALEKGAAGGCPFSKNTLLLLRLKDADKNKKANDLIFMKDSWSRCPAEQWVPAVIAGTWKRVMANATE